MSLPTRDNILTMDYSFQGQPYVQVSSKSSIVVSNMDYSFQGQPFFGTEFPVVVSNINRVSGISRNLIKIISGVEIANIKEISGIA